MLDSVQARQSAIFWLLGHYYEWPLHRVSAIFGEPYGLFAQELYRMGFPREEIVRLQNNDHPTGWCRTCRKEITGNLEFCSSECREKENRVKNLISKGYVPLTLSKYGFYSLTENMYKRITEINVN